MAGEEKPAPIVVIGKPHAVDQIERQLGAADVERPVILFTSVEDGRDFLTAACVAAPVDDRFIPCLILMDGGIGSDEKETFARWARRQAALAETRLVLVDASGGDATTPAHYDRFTPHAGPQRWRALIAQVCE
jgi:hypothetical protein